MNTGVYDACLTTEIRALDWIVASPNAVAIALSEAL